MLILQIFLSACLACSCIYWVLCVYSARHWYNHASRFTTELSTINHQPSTLPAVTILKPLRGTDPEQYENFGSFCKLDYPDYQVVFGALDASDSGLETARKLKADIPSADIAIVAGGEPFGTNLKVCNLQNMMITAKHDIIVLCDSDMRVGPDYLKRITAPFLDSRVGLVTCPYRGYLAEGPASRLEALGIGADFMPSVMLTARFFGMGFAFGSTIAIRRGVLEEIGGFRPLANELADDYRLGSKTRAAGYEVVLSDYVVDNVLRRESFREMWKRRLRWSRTTRAMHPMPYFCSIITHTGALGLLLLASTGFNLIGWEMLGGAAAIRGLAASWIGSRYLKDYVLPKGLLWMPLSDLVSFALWAGSFLGSTVEWRGEEFKVKNGGTLIRL